MIIYDVSRLLSRVAATTPSGIDRVDIRYYFYIYENYKDSQFVFFHKGKLHIINREFCYQLLNVLASKWNIQYSESYVELLRRERLLKIFKAYCNHVNSFNSKCLSLSLLRLLANNKATYINTSHTNLNRIRLLRALKEANVKILLLIHDLIPITHAEYCQEGERDKHIIRINSALENADLIFTNSLYTRNCLHEYCLSNKRYFNKDRLVVNYLGTENLYINISNQSSRATKQIYFVAIGTIEPRKNYLFLLNIWKILSQEFLDEDCPKLYIIGKRGWINSETVSMLDRCQEIQSNVIHLEDVSDTEMAHLIYNSQALLAPSYVEGWGMPISETIAMGVPVLCSDIEVYREHSQKGVTRVPVNSYEDWLNLIRAKSQVKRQAKIVINSEVSTWEEHFNKLNKNILLLGDK